MKKKILIVTLILSVFLSGMVMASSVNGDFHGDPIVKLRVNGTEVQSEVPGHIRDGSTLLPIRAISESLGANVKWHPEDYSVDVTMQSGINKDTLAKLPGGVRFQTENGLMVASTDYVQKIDYNTDWPDIWQTFEALSAVSSDILKLNYIDKDYKFIGSFAVEKKYVDELHSGAITGEKLSTLITFSGSLTTAGPIGIKEIAKLKDRVGYVLAVDASGQPFSQGSGFMIEPGFFITNYHVAGSARELKISLDGSEYSTKGYHMFANKNTDVFGVMIGTEYDANGRVLKGMPEKKLKYSTKLPEVGDKVYAIGSPKGLNNTLSEGIVSGIREVEGVTMIQHTADIEHGSSGGALLNESGEVIGITSAGIDGTSIKFAIPMSYIQQELDKLK